MLYTHVYLNMSPAVRGTNLPLDTLQPTGKAFEWPIQHGFIIIGIYCTITVCKF